MQKRAKDVFFEYTNYSIVDGVQVQGKAELIENIEKIKTIKSL